MSNRFEMNRQFPNIDLLLYWILERHSIYLRRRKGKPPPWTADPILQAYRFCNVYRENDRVTKWIAKHWRKPNADNPDLWFAMAVARYVNEPATLALMPFPVPWNPMFFQKAIRERMASGQNAYNPAYIISTGGLSIPKHEYLTDFLGRLWSQRKQLRPKKGMTLREYCDLLVAQPGLGKFMVGQIIADLKYAQMQDARDWFTFASSGPGSRRGMNRLLDRPVKQGWREEDWFAELQMLQKITTAEMKKHKGFEPIHGQDLQNCLCEFDKFMRVKLNEGRPKQKFTPRLE